MELAVFCLLPLALGVLGTLVVMALFGRKPPPDQSAALGDLQSLLSVRDRERVILVSDPFHLLRASIVARRHGLTVRTSPTSTGDLLGRITRQPSYFFSESVKAPVAFLFEW
jgi:hypothetical protein